MPGEEVGRLKASCVEDMALALRVFTAVLEENRFASQLISAEVSTASSGKLRVRARVVSARGGGRQWAVT